MGHAQCLTLFLSAYVLLPTFFIAHHKDHHNFSYFRINSRDVLTGEKALKQGNSVVSFRMKPFFPPRFPEGRAVPAPQGRKEVTAAPRRATDTFHVSNARQVSHMYGTEFGVFLALSTAFSWALAGVIHTTASRMAGIRAVMLIPAAGQRRARAVLPSRGRSAPAVHAPLLAGGRLGAFRDHHR